MAGSRKRRQARHGASRPKPRRAFPLRRVGWGAFWLSLLGVMAWGIACLTNPQILPMRKVMIKEQFKHVAQPRLHEAVAVYATGGFFSVDLQAVQAAAEQLPWVAGASVHRVWPDSLQIQIKEQVALARWGEDALVSIDGEIFRPPKKSFPKGLPKLKGPSGSEQLLVARFTRAQAQLRPLGLQVVRLTMGERRDWRIELEDGMELVLGRAHSTERLARFRQIYTHLLQFHREDIERVDMRYTNGFAVTWRGGVAPAWLRLRGEGLDV